MREPFGGKSEFAINTELWIDESRITNSHFLPNYDIISCLARLVIFRVNKIIAHLKKSGQLTSL